MQITVIWSNAKPEVEFLYGERLFFKNGSSYIAAVNREMSIKFGLLIDFDLLKSVTSTNTKPEVVLNFVIFYDSMSSLQSINGFNLDSDLVQKFLKDYAP